MVIRINSGQSLTDLQILLASIALVMLELNYSSKKYIFEMEVSILHRIKLLLRILAGIYDFYNNTFAEESRPYSMRIYPI